MCCFVKGSCPAPRHPALIGSRYEMSESVAFTCQPSHTHALNKMNLGKQEELLYLLELDDFFPGA